MHDDILIISEEELKEIENLLKTYAESEKESSSLFVFFDPTTGSIKSIASNSDEIEFPYIMLNSEIDKEKVNNPDAFYKFKVIFDPEQKKNVLIEINLDAEQFTKVEDLIYQVPLRDLDNNEDIVIIQDTLNKKWEFQIDQKLSTMLSGQPLPFDYYNFYVTEFNDPNILHRTIVVSLAEMIDNGAVPIDFLTSYEEKNLSIFGRKHFSTHAHIKR